MPCLPVIVELFLGLAAEPNGILDGSDTSRFKFVDGSDEGREFFETPGRRPWASSQPDDSIDVENCVLYFNC